MNQRTYTTVSGAIFSIIALLHGARVVQGWEARIGNVDVPLWLSLVALIIAGSLAWSAWKLRK